MSHLLWLGPYDRRWNVCPSGELLHSTSLTLKFTISWTASSLAVMRWPRSPRVSSRCREGIPAIATPIPHWRGVVWFISPWKAFRCSAMLEPSWYLSLTILLMTETLFRAFFFSNMPPIFFHKTSTSGSSLKLFPKPKHLLWQLCPCHIVLATTGLYTQACLSSSTSKLNSLGRSASTSHQGIHPYSYTCEGTPLALIPVWYGYGLATACKQAEMKAIRNRNYKDRHGVLMWKS